MKQEKRATKLFPGKFVFKLAALAIGLMLPVWYLLAKYWPTWIDYILRGMLLSESSNQVWSGELYPRWLIDTNDGLGSPVMLFQPMFSYYFAVLLQPLASIDPHGFGRILIIISIFLFLGGLGCYAWLREYFDDHTAQLGAIAYLIFPSVFWSMYYVMSMHGILGMALYPWFLFIAKRMLNNPWRYGPYYALLQAALTLDSLWSTIVFSAVPIGFVIFLSPRELLLKNSITILFASATGLLLAAVYWLPVIENKHFILSDDFTKGDFSYEHNFVTLHNATKDIYRLRSFLIDLVFPLTPMAVSCFYLKFSGLLTNYRKESLFFLSVIIGAAFMCLPASKIVWDNISFIGNIQFPSRFMDAAIPAMIFLMCCWMPRFNNLPMYYTIAIISGVMLFAYAYNDLYSADLSSYNANVFEHKLVPQNTHMTIWMKDAGIKEVMDPPSRFVNVPPANTIDGQAEISKVKQTPRSISFKANVISQSAKVALKRYYYPGWIVPEGMPGGIGIIEHDALLAVSLPHGEYNVTIIQPWFPGEKEAVFMSSAGLAIVLAWAAMARRRILSN